MYFMNVRTEIEKCCIYYKYDCSTCEKKWCEMEGREAVKEIKKQLSEICETYEDDCNKCPNEKECNIYCHIGGGDK